MRLPRCLLGTLNERAAEARSAALICEEPNNERRTKKEL